MLAYIKGIVPELGSPYPFSQHILEDPTTSKIDRSINWLLVPIHSHEVQLRSPLSHDSSPHTSSAET